METGFRLDLIGRWSEGAEGVVDQARAAAYAAATNYTDPRYLSGERIPPLFAVTLGFAGGPAICTPELFGRLVHGAQEMEFHRPMEPGMTLVSSAAFMGIQKKSSGVVAATQREARTLDGELVTTQWMTVFFRGVDEDVAQGELAPEHRFDERLRESGPIAEVSERIDGDQTYRYAPASGDLNPIHTDVEFAKSVGLPGIIVHGLCSMAFASRAVIDSCADGDGDRLRRLAVRFSMPVLPAQELTTTIWDAGSENGNKVYAFESATAPGMVVMKDGWAEFSG